MDDTLVGQAYQQWLRGQGYDPAVLASRVPERFAASPTLAADYRRVTEDRGVQPLPGGQVARRAIDAMPPAERDRYASDWERLDARQQTAYEAMSAPAREHYAGWRADFERTNALPPAETAAEHAADLLGALIASATSPEGLVGFVPPAANGLAIVKQTPKLAQELVDLVNATVQTVRNRLGRNATPQEVVGAVLPSLSPTEARAVMRIDNILNINFKSGPRGDVAGAVGDSIGSRIPKRGGGYYDHVEDINNLLRGLRNHIETLRNSTHPAAIASRKRAMEVVHGIEDAFRGLGI